MEDMRITSDIDNRTSFYLDCDTNGLLRDFPKRRRHARDSISDIHIEGIVHDERNCLNRFELR